MEKISSNAALVWSEKEANEKDEKIFFNSHALYEAKKQYALFSH